MDILIGTSVGGYILKQFIGSGGMGAVYLAEDQAIGQQVAIKIMHTDSADLPDASSETRTLERFKQEARAVANLDHLHILPLYRYGEEETSTGKRAYMVMQYRPEGSLWDWLRRRGGISSGIGRPSILPPALPDSWPLSLSETNEYLQQAASALQYAHEHGIIHRDIKPANFLLRIDNATSVHLLLSDFGLAKFFASSSATSTILGTPIYMAPEQFEGNAGPESDQYALAVMIYLLLAGRPPFEGDPLRLMHAHLAETPPSIRSFVPALPQKVDLALMKALARKPEERYPSIIDFAHAFQTAAKGQFRIFASPLSPRPYLSVSTRQTPENAPTGVQPWVPPLPSTQSLLERSERPVTLFAGDNAPPGVQPSWVPPVPAGSITPSELLEEDDAPTVAQPLPSSSQGWPAFGSPVPQNASPERNAQSSSSPATPAPPEPLADTQSRKVGRRSMLAWIAGGTAAIIVGGSGAYLYLHNATATSSTISTTSVTTTRTAATTTTITSTTKAIVLNGHQDVVTAVSWSPDGTQLVSTSRDSTARIWSAANWQTTAIYSGHQAAVLTAAWRHDGSLLASGGEDKSVQTWNPTGVAQHTFSNLGSSVSSISWDLNNEALVAGTLGSGSDDISLKTGRIVKSAQNFIIHALAFSPDGQRLALAFDNGAISIYDVTTRHSRTYHRHNGAVLCLAWSFDGSQLASGGSDYTLHIIDTSTGHSIKVLQHHAPVNGVAWEPAGTTRVASACEDGIVRLWNVREGSHTTYKASAPVTSVSWNTNGLAAGSTNHRVLIWKV